MNNNYIKTKWVNKDLVVEAKRAVKAQPMTIVNCHKFPSYGKVLGEKYTHFDRRGNHIVCTIPQKISFFTINVKFEKFIERFYDSTYVHFRTVDSAVDIHGLWKISPCENGTLLELGQTVKIPAWAKLLPVEKIMRGKIDNILNQFAKID
jgi:hypothetical protein